MAGVVVLTPLVKAVAPPVPSGRLPCMHVVILPDAGPVPIVPARSRIAATAAVVYLSPAAGGRVRGAWGGRVFPGPEHMLGDDALGDQVVRGEAAGLEQDAVVGGGGDVGVGIVAAPRRRGAPLRASLVTRGGRSRR